jgi:hypothetical protein
MEDKFKMDELEKIEIQKLVEKWSNTEKLGDFSIASLDENLKESMAQLLENVVSQKSVTRQINEASFANSTASVGELGSTAAYKPISLALMRRTMPVVFAQKAVGFQPMRTPVGLAYALRVIYNHLNGTNGPEAAWDQVPIYSGFTGTTSGASATYSASAAGTGVDTSVGEAWSIGTDYPQLKVVLEQVAIIAKTRKLAASFSLETAQDISAMHNIDIQRELIRVLQAEVIAEMDREIIAKLRTTAVTGTGGAPAKVLDLNATSGASYVDGRWSQEQISSLVTSIIHQANVIAISTRRGAGNFAVVSSGVATALQAARPSFQGVTAKVNPTRAGVAEIGTLNGDITIYRDQYATDEYALVGYKGEGQNDCGIILSPYLMNVVNTGQDPNTFAPRIGVMSRYAITDSLLGSGRYYRLINYHNMNKVVAGY